MPNKAECPCGSGQLYVNCCGRFIDGDQLPQTPEQLMRSRYTAYTHCNISYIAATMCGDAKKGFSKKSALKWSKSVIWNSLRVLAVSPIDAFATHGTVSFEARFSERGRACVMAEISQFERISGRWFYVSGVASSHQIESD